MCYKNREIVCVWLRGGFQSLKLGQPQCKGVNKAKKFQLGSAMTGL